MCNKSCNNCNNDCNKASDILQDNCCGNLLPMPKTDLVDKVKELEQTIQELQQKPKMSYNELFIWASGFFLYEPVTEELLDIDNHKELDEYLVQNAWEPFEHADADFLFEQIAGLSNATKQLLEE